MNQLAQNIVPIIKDYHNYLGFQFTEDYVINWANQFDEADREFVLQELLHLLNQPHIYISEDKARQLLIRRIERLSAIYGVSKTVSFLANADILSLQGETKSQTVLLKLLHEELQKKYGIGPAQCGTASKKYAVYIDDVLATGGSLYRDMNTWLPQKDSDGKTNLDKVVSGEIFLSISHFCSHNGNTTLWRLKEGFKKDAILKKLKCYCDYEIQNHLTFPNQKFNFTYPVASQDKEVTTYFNSLPEYAHKHEEKAFRKPDTPANETFFSSVENRVRFENILLAKGIELLNNAKYKHDNHRPLGATIPSYKILGTGTLFFTWRNISNTTPIVFWWSSPGWSPLFPLYKRGQ